MKELFSEDRNSHVSAGAAHTNCIVPGRKRKKFCILLELKETGCMLTNKDFKKMYIL